MSKVETDALDFPVAGFLSQEGAEAAIKLSNLNELRDIVQGVNIANGWFEAERTMAEDIVLIATELGELGECLRDSKHPAPEHWYSGDKLKPEGIMSELADILIRVLDMAVRSEGDAGITIGSAVAEKLIFNASRGYKHGNKAL